jgi:hypothetical protein
VTPTVTSTDTIAPTIMIAEKGFFFVVGPVLASNIRIRCKVIGSCLADIKRLKGLNAL